MNVKLPLLLAACVLVIAGCSTVPTHVNKGAVHGATYSLMTPTASDRQAANPGRDEVNKEIQGSIRTVLEKKGLRQVAAGGDVQVAYLVVVANNATTLTYDEYFGFENDAAALSDKAHTELAKKSSRDYFNVGALVIDIVNPRNSELTYRSYVTTDMQDMTPSNRGERINLLVDSCLGKLQVAK